ncbi:lys-63-specific deubiquitinase BRCC36-like [Argiope bruennichi]|uniref:lys-63-specific deubiquitinase BRCC36-like n=1 Tax=Argiope bruennichi TaxID=94029 RepID=UPI002494DD64|nr:lys-63-specific deubiquitinase BRCC36-like [Argiope bruennichi]
MPVLRHVNMSTDVYFVCLNHAMSTDGEEIVGLLVGEVDENRVAHVSAIVILRRSDKRKDRVEISPEQLSNASTEAERLACILKRPIRVIGWYHSHPKLTVWPSPIDVNTQDSYQLMDEGFIGVIFSVFNEDPNKKGGRIQMTCFQSQTTLLDECNVEKKRLDIPIHLVPTSCISSVCMNALIQLPRFLCQEENLAYQMTSQVPLDYLTRLHNSSVYIKAMGQIAEVICGPLLKMLEERIINNEMKRKKLLEKKKELMARIEEMHKEVDKMKIEEENANVQPSTDNSTSTSQPIEENEDVSPKSPVESSPLPENKEDVSECTASSTSEIVDKQSDVNKSDKMSGESGSVEECESIKESNDNVLPEVDKCEVRKKPSNQDEPYSPTDSITDSPISEEEEEVSIKISNIPADNN